MIFLRPWFLLLILLPFLFRFFRERLHSATNWEKVIDKSLLPYLLVKGSDTTAKQRSVYKLLLWIALSVAAAGPAWNKEISPSRMYQPSTVIILEMSPAMNGTLLTQAKRKIQDMLPLLKNEQVALVIYDRFGYAAAPLTYETDIIKDMLPYVKRSVLPGGESDPAAGFERAEALLKNAGVKSGRILFLTSGAYLSDEQMSRATKSNHKIGILGIGGIEPHPIPLVGGGFMTDENGKPIMIYLDPNRFSKWGAFQNATLDDTDIINLINDTRPDSESIGHNSPDGITLWQDMGGWILVLTLPFFAFLFRRGTVLILIIAFSFSAHADLWHRPDQEAYMKQIDAVRIYRRGQYADADKIFQVGKLTDDLYNHGNALAFQQKIEEAIEAYARVLQRDPTHEDARYNKEYLEKILQQQKEEQERKEQEEREEQERLEQEQREEQERLAQEQREEEQKKQLERLKELLAQENELKQQELEEIDRQQEQMQEEAEQNPPPKQDETKPEQNETELKNKELENLADKIMENIIKNEEKREQLSNLNPQNQEKLKQELQNTKKEIENELTEHQDTMEKLDDPKLENLKDLMNTEKSLKEKSLDLIRQMVNSQEEVNQDVNSQEEANQDVDQKQEETMGEDQVKNEEVPEQGPKKTESDEAKPNNPDNVTDNWTPPQQPDEPFEQDEQQILNKLKNDPETILRYRIRQQYLKQVGDNL